MAANTRSPRRRKSRGHEVHKPRGVLHPRVQQVQPEHFGVVSVDCAKARSKWMLCDFYGRVLVPPTEAPHSRGGFALAIDTVHDAMVEYELNDLVVAIERTGRYHHPVKRAFAEAGFEVRVVHPFATKQFRLPADPGNKTDDTDLSAIHRAAVNGFGLLEPTLDGNFARLRLLVRHRRDLVRKSSALRCQIGEHLEAGLPGYARLFKDLFQDALPLAIARLFSSPAAVQETGVQGLERRLREAGIRFQRPSLSKIVAWAGTACGGDAQPEIHQQIWIALEDDRAAKARQIQALEREIAALLVATPYVLLMSLPGINVVSAGELAGEMGPIEHYAHARAITGRAGLFPSRAQSDQVDRCNGKLVRRANRALRQAILMIADNLLHCNQHFRGLAANWKRLGKDARDVHVKVAGRFCRIAYQMVAGRQVFQHPACQQRDCILEKLIAFHREHETPGGQLLRDLQAGVDQLPRSAWPAEAAPLASELARTGAARRRGPQLLSDLLPVVLAKLGAHVVESKSEGEQDPH
jgi:transposase